MTHSGIIWGIPSGDAKKMGAVAPIDLLLIHEPQVRSADERRRLQAVPVSLTTQLALLARSHTGKPPCVAGLVKCGRCGCACTGEIKKGQYICYHCPRHKGPAATRTFGKRIS